MSDHQKEKQPTKSRRSATSKVAARASSPSKSPLPSIDSKLQVLAGVGPKKAALFERKGIFTLRDAAEHFPYRYEDRRQLFAPSELVNLPEGALVSVAARLTGIREVPLRHKRRKMVEAWLENESQSGQSLVRVRCLWFNSYPGLLPYLRSLHSVVATGQIKFFRHQPQITHPELEARQSADEHKSLHWGRIVPIYSTTSGITQRAFREVISQALKIVLPLLQDDLPDYIRSKYKLIPFTQAIAELHFPREMHAGDPEISAESRRTLIFTEFFKFQLLMLQERKLQEHYESLPLIRRETLANRARATLPFQLTSAQERAIDEILRDLQQAKPMHRLVQGDVGCGKTLVALISCAEAIENQWQCALMTPTETLAEQHYLSAKALFDPLGIKIDLLTGSIKAKERRAVLDRIATGTTALVIGTNAIIQESVVWRNLHLAIVDEQHRFGVKQRLALRNRQQGKFTPHLLTMTATPIPRSLALTVFGDLDVSNINQLPANRKKIATKVLPGAERRKLYNLIHREAKLGRQSYIVYPLVESSEAEGMEHLRSVESEFSRLQGGPLLGLRVACLHGRTATEERQSIMAQFKAGAYDVLLSTTVIEVGVDVPNATVMAIENAERFGLSQIHQLRGRVGRGEYESYCVLVTDIPAPTETEFPRFFSEAIEVPSATWKRLRVLENSQDGFVIAEEDLKLRGPGDFLGTKQSGAPSFRLADIERDRVLLESARLAAQELLRSDPLLNSEKHQNLQAFCRRTHARLGETIHSG